MDDKGIPTPYDLGGQGRFSKADLECLKIFIGNETLLKLLRKVFLGYDLTTNELESVEQMLAVKGLPLILRKVFIPELDANDPLSGMASLWSDRRYADMLLTEAKVLCLARQDTIKFFELGLERLAAIAGGNDEIKELPIDLNLKKDYENEPPEKVKRAAVAFMDSVMFVDMNINQLNVLASLGQETPEQRAERLKRDSSK